jgi:hypothetical protein
MMANLDHRCSSPQGRVPFYARVQTLQDFPVKIHRDCLYPDENRDLLQSICRGNKLKMLIPACRTATLQQALLLSGLHFPKLDRENEVCSTFVLCFKVEQFRLSSCWNNARSFPHGQKSNYTLEVGGLADPLAVPWLSETNR